jgi:signal peptidase I
LHNRYKDIFFSHIMPSLSPSARSALRATIEGGACLIMLLLFSQTWFIEGLIVPCRITGGSMAVALLGMHRSVVCDDCGFGFYCDSAVRPASPRAVCPNCGHVNNSMELLPDLDGDRVLIDRAAFHFRRPQRWEIAAFRRAEEAGKILIKRVVGLPGESVQIQNGDVYINGQIQRKPLDRQRSMAVMVYDADYSPALRPLSPKRWRGEDGKTLWKSVGGRFSHISQKDGRISAAQKSGLSLGGEKTIDWLVYHHCRRIQDGQSGVQECPVTDIMAYNQSLPRREEDIHGLNDLMLSFRLVKTFGRGLFYIRAIAGKDAFQIEIDPDAGLCRATRNDNEFFREDNCIAVKLKELDVVVSLIDRQFLLAFNGRTVLCLPINDQVFQSDPTSQPFALGTAGLGVVVENLRIYRDVYYTHPIGWPGRWALEKPIQLGEDEYFVLGDNSSIAEDSRTWPERSPVVANLLIGKPLMILFPAKSMSIGVWQLQVPDLSRIGYIR